MKMPTDLERAIGNAWNLLKPPEMPLWWCLREESRQRWREAMLEADPVAEPEWLGEMARGMAHDKQRRNR